MKQALSRLRGTYSLNARSIDGRQEIRRVTRATRSRTLKKTLVVASLAGDNHGVNKFRVVTTASSRAGMGIAIGASLILVACPTPWATESGGYSPGFESRLYQPTVIAGVATTIAAFALAAIVRRFRPVTLLASTMVTVTVLAEFFTVKSRVDSTSPPGLFSLNWRPIASIVGALILSGSTFSESIIRRKQAPFLRISEYSGE